MGTGSIPVICLNLLLVLALDRFLAVALVLNRVHLLILDLTIFLIRALVLMLILVIFLAFVLLLALDLSFFFSLFLLLWNVLFWFWILSSLVAVIEVFAVDLILSPEPTVIMGLLLVLILVSFSFLL